MDANTVIFIVIVLDVNGPYWQITDNFFFFKENIIKFKRITKTIIVLSMTQN